MGGKEKRNEDERKREGRDESFPSSFSRSREKSGWRRRWRVARNCVESRQPKQGSCFPLVGIIPNYSKVMKQFANINCLFQKDIKKSFGIVCGIQRMFLENAFFLFLFFLSDTLSLGKELFV